MMMKRTSAWVVAGMVCLMAAGMCLAADDVAKVAANATPAMARLEFKVGDNLGGEGIGVGQAICIDKAKAVFVTGDIPNGLPADEIKGIVLIAAGTVTPIKAEFLGHDPEQNLAFLKATGGTWGEVKFVAGPIELGQKVVSIGLYGPAANAPYLGIAEVAGVFRVPAPIIYVSGGTLTTNSSPVFTADGKAIGLVLGAVQIPAEVRLVQQGRAVDAQLIDRNRGNYFLPAEEFAYMLDEIPTPDKPRRLPWIGVLSFDPVAGPDVDALKLDKAAVRVGQVVPDTPATKAGLKQSDVIVAVDGKPLDRMVSPALTTANFYRKLIRSKPGAKVILTVLRDGKEQNLQVTTEEMPLRGEESPRYYNPELGFAARQLTKIEQYARQGSEPMPEGLAVFRVRPGSPADNEGKGLKLGDLIQQVVLANNEKKPVKTVAELKAVLDPLSKPGSTARIELLITRGTTMMAILINPAKPATQPGLPVPPAAGGPVVPGTTPPSK